MSALIGICKSDAVYLLTDSVGVSPTDGFVVGIYSKQLFIRRSSDNSIIAALAWNGWAPPALEFVVRAQMCCSSFDDLVIAAPMLWQPVRNALPPPTVTFRAADGLLYQNTVPFCFAIAGRSESRRTVELYDLSTAHDPDGAQLTVLASGGIGESEASDAPAHEFTARFCEDPEPFDPSTDGVEFIRTMRRQVRQFSKGPPRHVVGGFVQCTTVTASGESDTTILHFWPDRVGFPITDADVDSDVPVDLSADSGRAFVSADHNGCRPA